MRLYAPLTTGSGATFAYYQLNKAAARQPPERLTVAAAEDRARLQGFVSVYQLVQIYSTACILDGTRLTRMLLHAGAVVGVVMFSNVDPDNFAVFDRAFLTLFYIAGGDPWPDSLPKFNEDGSANWVVAAYIMGYTMIEIWVILQVSHRA